jgi:hypothetical protein
MIILRHCLAAVSLVTGLLIAPVSYAATAPALPAALVGSYQGLVQVPGSPEGTPFGRIEFSTTSAGKATGKLVLIDKKPYPFVITLIANEAGTEATGAAILVKKLATKTTPQVDLLTLNLVVKSDGTFDSTGNSSLPTLPPSTYEDVPGAAFKTPVFVPVKAPCPWLGAYTASFSDAEPAGTGVPVASGYMTGAVSTAGVMTVAGKLADGTAFTGSMKPSADGRHFLFLTPYTTTIGGYFVSSFQLTPRSDTKFHVSNGNAAWTKWKKPAYSKDKLFPAGFGPLDVFLTMAQWTAPVGTAQNVGTVMGIDLTEVFGFGLENVINPTTYAARLPLKLGLNANNTFRVAEGGAGSPLTPLVALWAKLFTGKVDPKTGLVTLSVFIEDVLPFTPPAKAKPPIKRTVAFSGVMFQLLPSDPSPIASGLAVVPPLTTADATVIGNFGFTGPVVVDPIYASAANTAGNYTVRVNMLEPATPATTGSPADEQIVPFTIASDLSSMKFFGRTIPLGGDSRPVSLVFSDASEKTAFNNLTVTVFLNTSTGAITGMNANYYQVQISIPPVIKIRTYDADSSRIVKLP